MKHIVNIEQWERKDNYNFFATFNNSWISITSEVDCTEALSAAKAKKQSFFLYYLYAIHRAGNEIKELRFRHDKNRDVVYYDTVDIITPIAIPGKTFCTVRIPYNPDFGQFYTQASKIVRGVDADTNPYEVGLAIDEQGDYDVLLLSAMPQLYFTSMTHTQIADRNSCTYPLTYAGKAVPREGRMVMPIAIYFNHAFVDGQHATVFFQKVEAYLKEIAK